MFSCQSTFRRRSWTRILGYTRFNSTSAWSYAIKDASSPHQTLHLYTKMQRLSVAFNTYSILFTLKSCAHFRNHTIIHHLHAHVLKLGFRSDIYVANSLLSVYVVSSFHHACILFDEMPYRNRNAVMWNTMISGFSKFGDVEKARWLFDEMPVRGDMSWSAMISGYYKCGHWDEGLSLFREFMMNKELKPDVLTLRAIVAGCGKMSSVGLILGRSIHGFATKNCWEFVVEHGSVLVDMYVKCGLLKYAVLVFERMQKRNLLSWTSLICGSARLGYYNEAAQVFERMKEEGVEPNEFTFTGILNACAHAGSVEEGRKYFKMMEEYGLKPRIQHHGCMVDLLGKAGRLGEAYEVIKTMPLEPDVIIWSSFLSACKVHKQFEMANRVIDRVMQMVRPENEGGVYALIADLYILDNKWDAAARVRELIVKQT